MMSMIYANDYRGESTIFKLMHKHRSNSRLCRLSEIDDMQ